MNGVDSTAETSPGPVFQNGLKPVSFASGEAQNEISCALQDLAMAHDYVAFLIDEADQAPMTAEYPSGLHRTFGRAISAIREDFSRLVSNYEARLNP